MLTGKFAIPQMIRGGGGSTKAAVIGITRSMAGDHGRQGIRVNCIVPGLVYGPMVAPRVDAGLLVMSPVTGARLAQQKF